MLATISQFAGLAISIGAIVVALVTKLNHTDHLKAEVEEIKSEKIRIQGVLDDIRKSIGEMQTEIRSHREVCEERHK